MDLTESDLTALRWSRTCNERSVGFLGPTVKRYGPLPEYAQLVASGLLTCREVDRMGRGSGNVDALGYFLTDAGLAALKTAE